MAFDALNMSIIDRPLGSLLRMQIGAKMEIHPAIIRVKDGGERLLRYYEFFSLNNRVG